MIASPYYALAFLIPTTVAIIVAGVAWRRRFVPGGGSLGWLMLALAIWSATRAGEALTSEIPLKILWSKFEYIGIASIAPLLLMFVLDYTRQKRFLTRPILILLWTLPLLTMLVAFTNEWHGWLWPRIYPSPTSPLMTIYEHGWWFTLAVVYNYILLAIAGLVLIVSIIRYPAAYLVTGISALVAITIPWAANFIYVSNLSPVPGLDPTPFSFTFTVLIVAWAILRHQMIDLLPVAREALLDSMTDGVLVADLSNRIIYINQIAQGYLGLTDLNTYKSIGISDWPLPLQPYKAVSTAQVNLRLDADPSRIYDLRISPLTSQRGLMAGRLFVLRDITEREQIHSEITRLKEFNEDIVQHMAEGIAIQDTQGMFIFMNPAGAGLLGYQPDEIESQHWEKIIAPEHWPLVQAADVRRTRGETDRYELNLLHKDGSRVPTLVAGSPRFDSRGTYTGTLAVFTQITERKRVEEAVRVQASQLETLNRVAQVLSATLNPSQVLEAILDELNHVVPYDSAAIFQIKGNALEYLEGRGFPNPDEIQNVTFNIDSPDRPNTVVVRTRAPFIVADAPAEYKGFNRNIIAVAGIRGWMGLPLLYRNQLIGMLTLDKQEPDFFTEAHAKLGLAFASQAAIAIENARLFETERTARLQAEALQAATSALSASLSLPDLLNAILVELQKVVPYDSAAIHQITDEQRTIIAGRGFENIESLMGQHFKLSPEEDHIGYIIARTRAPLVVGDVQVEYRKFWHGPHAQTQTRGWLGVPLLFGDKLTGLLTLDKHEANFYTETHGRLALSYATQAAIAIENAQLFEAVSNALHREQNLKDVIGILSSTLDLPTTLQNFVRMATEIVGAETGVLAILSPDQQHIAFPHAHNLPPTLALDSVPRGVGIAWTIIENGEALLLDNYTTHTQAAPHWIAANAHGFIGVPVTAGGERIGVLGLFYFDPQKRFTPQQLDLAKAIGHQAAIALQNARHFERERNQGRRQASLFRLSAELAAAQDEESIWQHMVDGLYNVELGYTHLDLMEVDAATGDRVMRAVCGYSASVVGQRIPPGQGLSERPILDGELHYTPDISLDPRHTLGLSTGSEADVPIKVNGRVVAVLVIEDPRIDAFSREDLDVFTAASNQTGLAIARALLLRETRQRLTELATINAISQAAAAHLNVGELFKLVGERIRETFDVQAVYIALLDQASGIISIPYWRYHDEYLDTLSLKLGQGLSSAVIQSRQPVLINQDYENRSAELGAVPVVQLKHGRHALSWLGVPIFVAGEATGCISIQNYERENVFTDVDVRLLGTIAANLGIAFNNAQLFTASQQRAAELDAALIASRSLTTSLDLPTVFDSVLAGVASLMGRTENVDLFLFRDGQLQVAKTIYGMDKLDGVSWKPPRPDGVTMKVANTGELIAVEDVAASAEFSAPGWHGAILSLPLKIGTRVVGVMNVTYAQPRTFSDAEQRVLRLLADQAAIAIENARLYEQSQEELEERARAENQLRNANARLQLHIAEIEALQTQLREQAVRDPLTGLFNRRYLEETLDRELYRSEREGEPVSVVMIDIDHFKDVNDSYGHKAGDLLLKALGHLLLNHTRRGDVACRYGGEEFVIIMPGASLVTAYERAEGWRIAFEQLNLTDEGQPVKATFSVGIALFPKNGNTSDAILRAADQALYASKTAGRNRVAIFD